MRADDGDGVAHVLSRPRRSTPPAARFWEDPERLAGRRRSTATSERLRAGDAGRSRARALALQGCVSLHRGDLRGAFALAAEAEREAGDDPCAGAELAALRAHLNFFSGSYAASLAAGRAGGRARRPHRRRLAARVRPPDGLPRLRQPRRRRLAGAPRRDARARRRVRRALGGGDVAQRPRPPADGAGRPRRGRARARAAASRSPRRSRRATASRSACCTAPARRCACAPGARRTRSPTPTDAIAHLIASGEPEPVPARHDGARARSRRCRARPRRRRARGRRGRAARLGDRVPQARSMILATVAAALREAGRSEQAYDALPRCAELEREAMREFTELQLGLAARPPRGRRRPPRGRAAARAGRPRLAHRPAQPPLPRPRARRRRARAARPGQPRGGRPRPLQGRQRPLRPHGRRPRARARRRRCSSSRAARRGRRRAHGRRGVRGADAAHRGRGRAGVLRAPARGHPRRAVGRGSRPACALTASVGVVTAPDAADLDELARDADRAPVRGQAGRARPRRRAWLRGHEPSGGRRARPPLAGGPRRSGERGHPARAGLAAIRELAPDGRLSARPDADRARDGGAARQPRCSSSRPARWRRSTRPRCPSAAGCCTSTPAASTSRSPSASRTGPTRPARSSRPACTCGSSTPRRSTCGSTAARSSTRAARPARTPNERARARDRRQARLAAPLAGP